MNVPLSPSAPAPAEAAALPAVELAGIAKLFPARGESTSVSALRGIDLVVETGKIVGVIGRSGAGKSTLIRLVNGLEIATSGRISLFGRDVTRLSEAEWRSERRNIGMVFQHFNLLSSRTVFDNVALPLEILGTAKAEINRQVTRLLEIVGLSDKRDRYPAELSGGQKQRVGIARALATEPRILLCDEATSALDPETTKSILALLKRVNRELGVTILLITHEIPVIKEICDEVAVLEAGEIIEHGAVFDVLTRPQHPSTARLVEGVTRVEIPEALAARLSPTASPGALAAIRIGFVGENATSPVISRLTTTIGVDVNILTGRIDFIGGRPFGSLIVSVPGAEPAFGAILASLKRLGFEIDPLGFFETEAATSEAPRHVA
ncbi:MAG: methionine ABC transporter ATP-binding protein [Rhizobiales bacterium PAR1]|nr:MAG: methionine ABC transporter ATP-binding protein [Rhizobiales bacterium PAR1]